MAVKTLQNVSVGGLARHTFPDTAVPPCCQATMGAQERQLDARKQTTASYHDRPSANMSVDECRRFIGELRQVAAKSFQHVDESRLPNYQCLSLDDPVRSLADKVIVCVRLKETGEMIAFTSAALLPIPSLPDPVLHLGLTCIVPSALSHGLTKMLVGGVARHYLQARPNHTIWVSNLAAVVSSLGNIGVFMDEVYPSPQYRVAPTPTHTLIAKTIVETPALRESMYLRPDVPFDWDASVFRGSTKGTVFEKGTRSEGTHRDEALDSFYRGLIDFERGDEVLQIAHFEAETLGRFLLRAKL